MALVRHAHADSLARDAIVLDLGDLARQGDVLRARAQAEADRIIAEGKAERARLIQGADAKGHAEGWARGLEEGRMKGMEEGRAAAIEETRTELAPFLAALEEAITSFEQEREKSRLSAARDLVVLAADVARRVTHRSIELDPSVVRDQLAEVLAMVLEPSGIIIEVHPDDVQTCHEVLPGFIEGRAQSSDIKVRERDDLARGSLVVRTCGGEIEASIDGQLDRIICMMMASVPGETLGEDA